MCHIKHLASLVEQSPTGLGPGHYGESPWCYPDVGWELQAMVGKGSDSWHSSGTVITRRGANRLIDPPEPPTPTLETY